MEEELLACPDTEDFQKPANVFSRLAGVRDLARATRILVVEDERHIARLLEFVLRKVGYELSVRHSAEEALLEMERRKFDALVLDLMLPGMSGLQFLRLIRAAPYCFAGAVVVLSGQWFEETETTLLEAGATAQCSKPIAPSSLLRKLRELGIHESTPQEGL